MAKISAEQLAFFEREGYLVVPDVFRPGSLDPLKNELTDIIHRESARLASEGRLKSTYAVEPFENRLAKICDEDEACCEEIITAFTGRGGGGHSGTAMFETLTHPDLLACVERFVGPEIVGSSVYRIRPKVPGRAKGVVPWHQDSGYFSPHCDRELILTCWIPLVDATPDNGCLQVLPRAHRSDVLEHFRNGPAGFLIIRDEDLPAGQPVTVPVPEGGVLFLSNRTPHASTPNVSDVVRWSIDVRYQAAALPNNVNKPPQAYSPDLPNAQIACYPPEADFVVHSRLNPGSAVSSAEAFHALRQRYEDHRPTFPSRWSREYGEVTDSA